MLNFRRVVACGWIWLAMALVAPARDGDLFPGRVFDVGSRPFDLVAVDLDRDGHSDLVTANYYEECFSVLYGRGDGTFEPHVCEMPADLAGFTGAVVVDLDDDGNLDVVNVAPEFLHVWLGLGNRAFAEPVRYYAWFWEQLFNSVAAADFNNDGRIDLVAGGDEINIHIGNGDGTLQPSVGLGGGNGEVFLVVGDFTGDGRVDLATDMVYMKTRIWRGGGDGTFTPLSPIDSWGRDALARDFNGDGLLDLALVDRDVTILLGRGNGRFEPEVVYDALLESSSWAMAAADLDNDGDEDLMVSGFDEQDAAVLLSNGDGTFAPAKLYRLPDGGGGMIATDDFDSDGRVDVAIASHWNGVVFTTSTGGQADLLESVPDAVSVGLRPYSVAVADVNGDGHPDMATANSDSNDVSIVLGNGAGGFSESGRVVVGAGPVSIAAGFFDEGSAIDLVVANRDSSDVVALLGDGGGNFVATEPLALGSAPAELVVADFNGDGHPDVATANPEADAINVLTGNGDGTFLPARTIGVGDEPVALVAVDLTGDGATDLAVANRGSDDVSIISVDGSGRFDPETRIASSVRYVRDIAAGDLDDDGNADLVLGGAWKPTFGVWFGDGRAGFSPPLEIDLGRGMHGVAIADLDGNGMQDLVASSGSVVSVLLSTAGEIAEPLEFAIYTPTGFTLGDVDRDGLLDLVAADWPRDRVNVLLNQAPAQLEFTTDKRTLAWPHLLGYDSFNVYRGSFSIS